MALGTHPFDEAQVSLARIGAVHLAQDDHLEARRNPGRRRTAVGRSLPAPHPASRFRNHLELAPLVVHRQRVADDGRGETALGAQCQAL